MKTAENRASKKQRSMQGTYISKIERSVKPAEICLARRYLDQPKMIVAIMIAGKMDWGLEKMKPYFARGYKAKK
jgi:hypothetical protein